MATAIKSLRPDVRVIGVEPEVADDAHRSRQAGQIVRIAQPRTIADGVATQSVGTLTFPVMQALTPSHFETVRSFVKGYRAAGPTLTVLRTSVGTAQSVAIALDKARWPEVIGTIAGDDTIFIATESAKAQRRLHDHLRTHFGR